MAHPTWNKEREKMHKKSLPCDVVRDGELCKGKIFFWYDDNGYLFGGCPKCEERIKKNNSIG